MAMLRWTSRDLDRLPKVEGTRYEVIDGELYVSTQPHWSHQFAASLIWEQLQTWSRQTRIGKANIGPGVIFSEDDAVIPDVIWISNERLAMAGLTDGHLHVAPELVVEILSPGSANERRDRVVKLELYSRRDVLEYWIVNWQARSIEVYRRGKTVLELAQALNEDDTVLSPHLPGFTCRVSQFFSEM